MVYNQLVLFEFDQSKSRSNKLKHGIDFYEAQSIWASLYFEISLKTKDEPRWLIIGIIKDIFWTAIITKRKNHVRLISVRRSRHEEKKLYQSIFDKKDERQKS